MAILSTYVTVATVCFAVAQTQVFYRGSCPPTPVIKDFDWKRVSPVCEDRVGLHICEWDLIMNLWKKMLIPFFIILTPPSSYSTSGNGMSRRSTQWLTKQSGGVGLGHTLRTSIPGKSLCDWTSKTSCKYLQRLQSSCACSLYLLILVKLLQ